MLFDRYFNERKLKIFFFIALVAAYGQVPILEVNGKYLAQTQTIARFLARKFNLTGADDWEAAKCDEVVDGAHDFSLCEFLYNSLARF